MIRFTDSVHSNRGPAPQLAELKELAERLGYRLRHHGPSGAAERYAVTRRGDGIVACTFSSLHDVRDWLAG